MFVALSDKLTIILNINQVELFYIGEKCSTKIQNLNDCFEDQQGHRIVEHAISTFISESKDTDQICLASSEYLRKYRWRAASTLENTDGEQRTLRKFSARKNRPFFY